MMKRLSFIIVALFLTGSLHAASFASSAWCRLDGLAQGSSATYAILLAGESQQNASLFLCELSPGADKWDVPEPVGVSFNGVPLAATIWVDTENVLHCAASLLVDGRNEVWEIVREGMSWTSPAYIGDGICTNAPLVDKNETIMALSSGESDVILYMREGVTWSKHAVTTIPSKCANDTQPVLVGDEKGENITAFCRSVGYGKAYKAVSTDRGESFCDAAWFASLPDRRFALTRLRDGRLVLVKHGLIGEFLYDYPSDLRVYLSDDEGNSWYGGLRVSNEGYDALDPVVLETSDGGLVIAYSVNSTKVAQVRSAFLSPSEVDASTSSPTAACKTVSTVLHAAGPATLAESNVKRKFASKSLRIASFNIQLEDKNWPARLETVESIFKTYKFDLVGSQEPNRKQIEQMMERIGDEYAWVGGVKGDEQRQTLFNPIFYRKSRLELLEWDTLWYSELPDTPGYGSFTPRMCIWAKFKDLKSGVEFYIFNSHFDHRGVESRQVSALKLIEAARSLVSDYPVFFTGDFNDDEDSFSYRVITSSGVIADSKDAVSNPVNAEFSSTGDYRPLSHVPRNGKHIDHLYFTPARIKVQSWELVTFNRADVFASDHFPIMIDCKLAL